MLGIIYVIFIFLVGKEFLPKTGQSRLWLLLPASFGVGTLAMGWTTYMALFWSAYVWVRRTAVLGKPYRAGRSVYFSGCHLLEKDQERQ